MLESVRNLVIKDLNAVDSLIVECLRSDVPLINTLSEHIFSSGGKRLRPLMILVAAHACDYQEDHHLKLAASIEFVHTATLLHDDVVDGSELRRGQKTANLIWGNTPSILVGDYLYARAFELMVKMSNMRVMQIVSESTRVIAEGEMMQLLHCKNPNITEAIYMQVIRNKTAALFSAALEAAATLDATENATFQRALSNYGMHVGTAFQIIDDVLDYEGVTEGIGKKVGDDLSEGKPTLPLIYVLEHGSNAQKALISDCLSEGRVEKIKAVKQALRDSHALDYAYDVAKRQVQQAVSNLKTLPASKYRDGLHTIAQLSLQRAT